MPGMVRRWPTTPCCRSAPWLVLVIIAMIGVIFGREAAQGYILEQIGSLVGPQSEAAIKEMIQRASEPSTGIFAAAVAGVTLLVGASGVFAQLQDSLNSIWGVKAKEGRGLWGLIRDRFFSVAALLGTGFLLLVSLVLSAALSAFGKWFGGGFRLPSLVLQILEFIISFGVVTGLFALILFKVLPDAKVAWRDVWVGSAMTALLFTIGKFAIGLYLGKSDVGSAYGAAGSMVILLVWVYYSAQIILFGAEFTQVYANALGSRIVASDNADVADPAKARLQQCQRLQHRWGRSIPPGEETEVLKKMRGPATGGCGMVSPAHVSGSAGQPSWWLGVVVLVSLARFVRRSKAEVRG